MDKSYTYFPAIDTSIVDAEQQKEIISVNPNFSGVAYQMEYYNNLPFPVHIGTRDGVKYTLQPIHDPHKPQQLIITRRVSISGSNVQIQLPNAMVDVKQEATYNAFQQGLSQNELDKSTYGAMRKHVVQQFVIESNEIISYKSFYLDNLDVLVSIDNTNCWHHPHSSLGKQREHMNRAKGINDQTQWGLNIELVTPPGRIFEKYVNINGTVFRIPVRIDTARKAGVYLSYNGLTTETLSPSEPMVEYYSWNDVDKMPFKLFDSWQDASVNGDIETVRKRELTELAHESNRYKAELERLKIERDALESERTELRNQQKMMSETMNDLLAKRDKVREEAIKDIQREMEMERMRYKHELEMQQMDRKDASEWIRWIPTIIGGVLTIAAFFIKGSQK